MHMVNSPRITHSRNHFDGSQRGQGCKVVRWLAGHKLRAMVVAALVVKLVCLNPIKTQPPPSSWMVMTMMMLMVLWKFH